MANQKIIFRDIEFYQINKSGKISYSVCKTFSGHARRVAKTANTKELLWEKVRNELGDNHPLISKYLTQKETPMQIKERPITANIGTNDKIQLLREAMQTHEKVMTALIRAISDLESTDEQTSEPIDNQKATELNTLVEPEIVPAVHIASTPETGRYSTYSKCPQYPNGYVKIAFMAYQKTEFVGPAGRLPINGKSPGGIIINPWCKVDYVDAKMAKMAVGIDDFVFPDETNGHTANNYRLNYLFKTGRYDDNFETKQKVHKLLMARE